MTLKCQLCIASNAKAADSRLTRFLTITNSRIFYLASGRFSEYNAYCAGGFIDTILRRFAPLQALQYVI